MTCSSRRSGSCRGPSPRRYCFDRLLRRSCPQAAFAFEVTRLLQPSDNVMEVVVDNRWNPDVAPLSADYTLFGGIYRDVEWIETPQVCIDPVTDGACGVEVDTKAADPTRPVVAASDRPAKRALNDVPEELAFNAYPGWYGDTTMGEDFANWFAASGRTLLAISEYGAGGNPFEHLDPLPPGRLDPGGPLHPEETQVKLHAANYREICAEPRLWGTFV